MFWKPINLAPVLYATVHKEQGGPIASISCRESERLGETVFEAFATLDHNHTGVSMEKSSLYGNSHGSGTAPHKAEAIYRAISEALERWAWFACFKDPNLSTLAGINQDPSTSGFAAFPGLTSGPARKNAYLEAAERWSLNTWWENKLSHRPIKIKDELTGISGIEILSPIASASIVVIWNNSEYGRAYGFSAGKNVTSAISKAKVELGRNIHVLKYAQESGALPTTRNERRLVYFSTSEGADKFKQRIANRNSAALTPPSMIVNCQVPGPWAKYTRVWRCLFDTKEHHDPGTDDYFHF